MIFSSFAFIGFFIIVLAVLSLTNWKRVNEKIKKSKIIKVRHVLILVASYIYYGWADWRFCFLLLVLTGTAYLSAIKISRGEQVKFYLLLGVMCPILILCFFKYYNFFLESITSLFNIQYSSSLEILLPLGISFYTFKAISYVMDVYRKKTKASDSFLKISLYISFFPQLLAGPIVKANDFLPQLEEERNVSLKNFEIGVQIFVFGLFKK